MSINSLVFPTRKCLF